MGIRPSVFTVFGIDNYHGSTDIDLEHQPFISDEDIDAANDWSLSHVKDYTYNHREKQWRWYHDLVYIGGRHSGANKGVLGWMKSSGGYDSDTFRALAMLYPEFFETSYRILPLEESKQTREARWRQRPAFSCGGIEFQEHWWYQQGFYWMTPVWAFATHWLLNDLGIETDPADYKWMLVWDWS